MSQMQNSSGIENTFLKESDVAESDEDQSDETEDEGKSNILIAY